MLLTSVMVTSVFSVALTAKTGGAKGERKIKAAAGARQVAAQLRNYITADETASGAFAGPGVGANSWSMDSGGVDDTSCANCYALSAGTHTLTGILPAGFEAAPYNARVIYHVTYADTVNGRPVPAVSITTTWAEP